MKCGLDWFRVDTSFDDKFELVCAEYGSAGFEIIVRLWQKIYQNGYYLEWNTEVMLLFAKRLGMSGGTVSETIKCAIRRGIFDKEMFDKYRILTSHGIQKWYFDSTERRNEVILIKEYLLISVPKNRSNVNIIAKNVNINAKNVCKNKHSTVQYRTGQDSRVESACAQQLDDNKINQSLEAFKAKCPYINIDTCDVTSIDFEKLGAAISASTWLQKNQIALSWYAKPLNYEKVIAGRYKDYVAVKKKEKHFENERTYSDDEQRRIIETLKLEEI